MYRIIDHRITLMTTCSIEYIYCCSVVVIGVKMIKIKMTGTKILTIFSVLVQLLEKQKCR